MSIANLLLTLVYGVIGILSLLVAYQAWRKQQEARLGTVIFWTLLGIIFIFGDWIPANLVGIMIIVMAVLSATKQIRFGLFVTSTQAFKEQSAQKLGNKLFIPALILAGLAFVIAQLTPLGAFNAIGLSGIVALIIFLFLVKGRLKEASDESTRLLSQVGPMAILPQILAALGSLFTVAGVGDVLASGVENVMVEGNVWMGVIAYCIGMAGFTAVMGNAFAAFSVITAGIGVPFVFAYGADPLIAGALGITAGFCGTLLTPMAANFNIVPASILELKNKYGVIKSQAIFGIVMLIIHIVLMRFLAF